MNNRDSLWCPGRDPGQYDRRWQAAAARGENVHGEADFVQSLGPHSVLDAGCGTGRVAIELARRGLQVIGVDADPGMLAVARQKAPHLRWVQADLVSVRLAAVEAVVLAGNVMLFLAHGTERQVVANMAAHLVPGGRLVNGFQLIPGRIDTDAYDEMAADAGLEFVDRFATWDGWPFRGGDYAVSVHRRQQRGARAPIPEGS